MVGGLVGWSRVGIRPWCAARQGITDPFFTLLFAPPDSITASYGFSQAVGIILGDYVPDLAGDWGRGGLWVGGGHPAGLGERQR